MRSTERVLCHCGHGTAAMREASDELERVSKLCLTEEELAAAQRGSEH